MICVPGTARRREQADEAVHSFVVAAQYLEETSMFYDVIGRARSVVVLKLKPQLPRDWEAHRNTFIHQPEPKVW